MRLARLLPCLFALWGCGYAFLDGSGTRLENAREIEIRMFGNASTEPGLEKLIAEALSEEFGRRGWLEPRFDAGADVVLAGEIRSVAVRSSAVSSVALSLEDRVEVVFDVSARRDGEVIYRHPDFVETELFRTSPDPNTYELRKEAALRRLSARVAERIHDELFQP